MPVLPRGLKCYDESDAEFFLRLLPGPRDRNGTPESVRAWKQRLEATDESAARICVLYGPSGCGKSSFLRAALIPRLERHVHVIRIDATERDMPDRVLRAIRSRFPDTPALGEAATVIQAVRQGATIPREHKLIIVIDQTEQWLRAPAVCRGDLPAILRQCDGERVQALLVVRDDFWRGQRFFSTKPVRPSRRRIVPSLICSIFVTPRMFSNCPGALWDSSSRSRRCAPAGGFVVSSGSCRRIGEHGRVSPARLALFTQMFRTRQWHPGALKEVGGIERLGAAFLEDAFLGAGATAQHRLHEGAARNVLSVLLPESGDVRDAPVPESELREASGYGDRPRLFAELLQVLDQNLRLLMPVEKGDSGPGEGGLWQLTHDQLVPAVRDWLHAREAATLRGRAGIRLKERAAEFRLRPNSRTAPGLMEWLRFRFADKAEPVDSRRMHLHATRSASSSGVSNGSGRSRRRGLAGIGGNPQDRPSPRGGTIDRLCASRRNRAPRQRLRAVAPACPSGVAPALDRGQT